jgi:cell division transport system permease protein
VGFKNLNLILSGFCFLAIQIDTMYPSGNRKNHPASARNFFYAIIALSILLYLLGALGLLAIYSNNAVTFAREQVPFFVELKDSASESEIFDLEQQLKKNNYVKAGSLRFISKDEAMKSLIDEHLTEEDLMIFGENLLPNSLEFHLNSSSVAEHSKIIKELKSNPIVANVFHTEEILNSFNSNLQIIGLLSGLLLIFFIFAALVLIRNTLKLSILSNLETIKILKISGAEKSYLRKPFLIKSLKSGLISASIAISGLLITVFILESQSKELSYFGSIVGLTIICTVLLLIGVITFRITTLYSLKKYIGI